MCGFVWENAVCVKVPTKAEEEIRCPELEVQVLVSYLVWLLEIELWSSERIAGAPHYWVKALGPTELFYSLFFHSNVHSFVFK